MINQLLDEILRCVRGTDVVELEVKTGEHSVRIVRSMEGAAAVSANLQTQLPSATAPEVAARPTGASHVISASMYGTFYRSSSPSHEPFVKEGQKVVRGDQLGVLEAMKTMHAVDCDVTGTIVRISASNGDVVEVGTELFVVEVDKHDEI